MFTQPFIQTQIKEYIKAPRHWPLCGEFTGTGEFPAQRASYAENVSIWWRHHEYCDYPYVDNVILNDMGKRDPTKWRQNVENHKNTRVYFLQFTVSSLILLSQQSMTWIRNGAQGIVSFETMGLCRHKYNT